MKSMFTWFRSNWILVFFTSICIALLLLNLKPERGYILTNDSYSPEINTQLSIDRSLLSPAWRFYRGIGIASDSEQADLFRTLIYHVTNPVLGGELANQVLVVGSILVAAVGIFLLTLSIVELVGAKVNRLQSSIIASLVYITSLWTIWVFNFPVLPYVVLYATMPWLLFAILSFIKNPSYRWALVILLVSLLSSGAYTVSTLFIVSLITVGLGLWSTLFESRSFIKRLSSSLVAIVLIFSTQLFWLLPFVTYVSGNASSIQASSINESITNSTIDLERERMTLNNSLRFYTRVLDIYEDNASESKMFKMADDYYSFELYRVLSYLPALLFIIGAVLSLYYKDFKLLPFISLYIIGVWGIKNTNPPLGEIYAFLQDNLDIFRQVFRWSSSKFSNLALVGLAPVAGIGFAYLSAVLFPSKKEYLSKGGAGMTLLFSALLLVFGSFLFNGSLFTDRAYTKFPQEYSQLNDYLEENSVTDRRILVLPPSNLGYFREYNFGFYGSGFLHYLLPNPLMEKALVVGSDRGEEALARIEQAYFAKNESEFYSLISHYNIEYILVDRNLVNGRYGYEIDWDLVDSTTSSLPVSFKSEGLALLDVSQVSAEGNLWKSGNGVGQFSPLNGDLVFVKREGNRAVYSSHKDLRGYSLDANSLDFSAMPTWISYDIDSEQLTLRPALPLVGGKEYELPSRSFSVKLGSGDFLKFNNELVSASKVFGRDIYLNIEFGNLEFIAVSREVSQVSLIPRFSSSSAMDCSGLSLNENTEFEYSPTSLLLGSRSALGCTSASVETLRGEDSLVQVGMRVDDLTRTGALSGLCIFPSDGAKCLNDNVFFVPDGSLFEVDIDSVSSSEASLIPYLYNMRGDSAQVEITQLYARYASFEDLSGAYNEKTLYTPEYTENQVVIPILTSSSDFSWENVSGHTFQFSVDKVENLDDVSNTFENGFVQTSVAGSTLYQYSPILKPEKERLYFYVSENNNVDEFPPILCIKSSDSPRCTVERSFSASAKSYLAGTFLPEVSGSNLEISFRTSSYSSKSTNEIIGLNVFSVPSEWHNVNYTASEPQVFNEILMVREDDNVSYPIFSSLITSSGAYLLDTAYSENWIGYVVSNDRSLDSYPYFIKQFLIPLWGERVDNSVEYDGWKQAWIIDGVEQGSILYALYKPNGWAYLGYGVLLLLSVSLLSLSIYEHFKSVKRVNGK